MAEKDNGVTLTTAERMTIKNALNLQAKSLERAMKAQRELGRQAIAEQLQTELHAVQMLNARL